MLLRTLFKYFVYLRARTVFVMHSQFLVRAGDVSEAALVRDILYVFQGIDGKFVKMNAQDNCYKIDNKVPGDL